MKIALNLQTTKGGSYQFEVAGMNGDYVFAMDNKNQLFILASELLSSLNETLFCIIFSSVDSLEVSKTLADE